MEDLRGLVSRMEPEHALDEISGALRVLFATLGEEARSHFLWELLGESKDDKVSSLVHL
jgi:hypothetical protein